MKTLVFARFTLLGATLAASSAVLASGFALLEQNASGLGAAYAGNTVGLNDASGQYFNPAGMSRLDGNALTVSAVAIYPTLRYKDDQSGQVGGNAGSSAVLPAAYLLLSIKPTIKVGLYANSPFGLQTKYADDWEGQTQAIKSKVEAANFGANLAWQATDAWSIGGGLSRQQIKGELTSAGGAALGEVTVTGKDSQWIGYLGALWRLTPGTRLGVSWRSGGNYQLQGDMTTQLPAANGPVNLRLKTPETRAVGLSQWLSEDDTLLADLTWTGWHTFQTLSVVDANSGAVKSSTVENWRDTWRLALGINHRINSTWQARAGLAWDQSPVRDAYRTARLPDADRIMLSAGGQYKASAADTVDFGLAWLQPTQSIPITVNPSGNAVSGSYQSHAILLGVQYAHAF